MKQSVVPSVRKIFSILGCQTAKFIDNKKISGILWAGEVFVVNSAVASALVNGRVR